MKQSEAAKLVVYLKAAYPRQPIDDKTTAVYERMLADLDPAVAGQAVKDLLATSRYFPTIAEVRERVAALRLDAPEPEHAWGEVVAAFGRFGRNREPAWTHPMVGEAVACLGWQGLCDSENPTADRARFLDAYKAIRARAKHEEQVRGVLPPIEERRRLARMDAPQLGEAAVGLLGGKSNG